MDQPRPTAALGHEPIRTIGRDELKAKADEQVQTLEARADRRREELRKAADADVAGVGEWS